MDVIKKNHTILFACETNGTKSMVCVVTELWTCQFWLSVPDCDHWVKHVDVTCWLYSANTTFKTYSGLKSFQIATSFQWKLSFFRVFFWLPWNPIQPSHYSVISLPPFLAWTLKNHHRDLESWLALLRCSHLVA